MRSRRSTNIAIKLVRWSRNPIIEPRPVIARLPEPILEPKEDFERIGVVPNVVFPTGALLTKNTLKIFYGGADRVCCLAEISMKFLMEDLLAHS